MMSGVHPVSDEYLRKIFERIIKLEADQESLKRQVVDSGELLQADLGRESHQLLIRNKIQILDDEHKVLQNRVQELFANLMDIEMEHRELDQRLNLVHGCEANDEANCLNDMKTFLSELKHGMNHIKSIQASKLDTLAAGSFLCPPLVEIVPSETWKLYFNTTTASVIQRIIPPCTDSIYGYHWLGGPKLNCSRAFQTLYIDKRLCHSFNLLHVKDLFQSHVISSPAVTDETGLLGRVHWSLDNLYVPETLDKRVPLHLEVTGETNNVKMSINHKSQLYNQCSEQTQLYEVAVHSPWELPTTYDHHFLKLPPTHSLYIAVTPELISYHPSTRDCQGRSQLFTSYQQSNCFLECRNECSLSLCGCVPLHQPKLGKVRWCGLRRRYCSDILVPDILTGKITWKVIAKYYQNEIYEDLKNNLLEMAKANFEPTDATLESLKPEACSCFCPLACSNVLYHLYTQLLPAASMNEYVSEVSVYYKEGTSVAVKMTLVSTVFTLSYLLGCIGGLLALFTGCNLLKVLRINTHFVNKWRKERDERKECLKRCESKHLNQEKTSQTEPLFMTNSSLELNSFV